jgi:hypothetical protein
MLFVCIRTLPVSRAVVSHPPPGPPGTMILILDGTKSFAWALENVNAKTMTKIIKAHLLIIFIITSLLQLVKEFPDILFSSWNYGVQHIIYVAIGVYYANSMPIPAWNRSKNERPGYTAMLLILFLWFLVK